ncbi:MAG: hypothetical protein AB7L28_08595 [Kofleriaceae bacterium]
MAASLLVAGGTASAQSPEAEALYREGRQLVKRGQIAAGCEKFAASERLESSIGTLLNLGDCRERLGAVASAWAAFRKAEGMAKRSGSERQQAEAARRASRLEVRLPYLSIEVPARTPGLVVRRNREPIHAAGWNTPLPVDPGQYVIVAEAPGRIPWRTTVTIGDGTKRHTVVVPALAVVPAPRPVPRIVADPAPSRSSAALTARAQPPTWTSTRKLAVVLGIAGAGALGAGGYYGWLAGSREDDANARCPQISCTDPEGIRLNRSARDAATRANILLAAGGGALVTGIVLWLVGAPGDDVVVAPVADSHNIGVSYAGSF